MADEVLHENEWVSLRKVVAPDRGINGYVYSHETRCGGRIVAVLPVRFSPAGLQVMAKCEVTPCWSVDEPIPSALTGGWEGGDPAEDAVRELWEEAGYEATTDELMRLGRCRGTKSTDTIYELYAVDVTRKVQHEAPGDGTRLESEAETRWLPGDEVNVVSDPIVALMYLRFRAATRRLLAAIRDDGDSRARHHAHLAAMLKEIEWQVNRDYGSAWLAAELYDRGARAPRGHTHPEAVDRG